MKETAGPSTTWIQRLFALFTLRKFRIAKSNVIVEAPPIGISTGALVAAENALRGIPITSARIEIGAVLNVIKEINTPTLNENTRRLLESNVRLLAELFEPLACTEPYLVSADLQRQLRRLSRELHTISQTMRQPASSNAESRRFFSHRNEASVGDANAFTRDISLALDRFRAAALSMYAITTMEAAIRALDIVSNSSCGLRPFLDWILRSGRVMDYRFGFIQTVRLCYRAFIIGKQRRDYDFDLYADPAIRSYYFLHVGLLNGRGFENWLEIELAGTSTRGTVTFAATNEALIRSAVLVSSIILVEQTLSVTDLAMRIEDICDIQMDQDKNEQFSLHAIFNMLGPYGRNVADPHMAQLYAEYLGTVWSAWTVTDDTIRREM